MQSHLAFYLGFGHRWCLCVKCALAELSAWPPGCLSLVLCSMMLLLGRLIFTISVFMYFYVISES